MHATSSTVSVIDYSKDGPSKGGYRNGAGLRPGGLEIWERYDSAIRKIMRQHGKSVGWDTDVDFYHGGDWFHELYNGFALMTTTALSTELLHDLQAVVVQHHSDAVLRVRRRDGDRNVRA